LSTRESSVFTIHLLVCGCQAWPGELAERMRDAVA
jgi:hypothetical protein